MFDIKNSVAMVGHDGGSVAGLVFDCSGGVFVGHRFSLLSVFFVFINNGSVQ